MLFIRTYKTFILVLMISIIGYQQFSALTSFWESESIELVGDLEQENEEQEESENNNLLCLLPFEEKTHSIEREFYSFNTSETIFWDNLNQSIPIPPPKH